MKRFTRSNCSNTFNKRFEILLVFQSLCRIVGEGINTYKSNATKICGMVRPLLDAPSWREALAALHFPDTSSFVIFNLAENMRKHEDIRIHPYLSYLCIATCTYTILYPTATWSRQVGGLFPGLFCALPRLPVLTNHNKSQQIYMVGGFFRPRDFHRFPGSWNGKM